MPFTDQIVEITCARMKERSLFERKKIRFVTIPDLIKCLKKGQILKITCVPISELPSNITYKYHAGVTSLIY